MSEFDNVQEAILNMMGYWQRNLNFPNSYKSYNC
ncbi:hypothetical protein SAMN05444266_106316 [Chitinophaga jiangningensis]|uniref:Uncharacterized protein n=1 Tax=Chitinophaga jiangningensis TaxID=1419482 RepID=A0A1M7FYJ8_9BACT|nr:hypothetical protein SAMN05444266_106316 [Chitinophaga jiangningensis]